MEKFYTGTATVDRRLSFARADQQFYEYIGSENYVSLLGNVHPDDVEYLKRIMSELVVDETAELVIHLMTAGGQYRSVLAELTGIEIEGDKESYIEFRIQDIGGLEDKLNNLCDENGAYSEFLDMWGENLFLYNVQKDSLEVFNGGSVNRIMSFRGTMEQFKDAIVQNHAVDEDNMAVFQQLCEDISKGTKGFEYKLVFSYEKAELSESLHVVKGKTILNSHKEQVVLGYISRRGNSDDGSAERVQNDFERDMTTGLLTKKAIVEYTENLLRHKPKYNVNLCVIDLDNFKQVNDTLGHMFGDEVLATVADILKEAVAGKGLAGRIGGDEMFIVLEGVNDLSDLRGVLRSIRSNVEWAYKERKEVPQVTCSIGVSTYPEDASSYDDLFKIADKMLYRAKQKGKNRYIVYSREVHGDVLAENEPVNEQNSVMQRQDKEELVLKMMEYLAWQTNRPYDMMLRDIGNTFGLDVVHLSYGDAAKIRLESYWNVNGGEKPADSFANYVHEENFVHLYREHDMAVIDKLDLIEQLCPQMYRYLMEHGVKVALIYKMNCRKHEGYIAYCKMSDMSRKWSDSDMANLAYISKIMELLINDR
ncbi:MAG: GGDEF domain-containing protein [Butyrivibrio sp.]|nr:GGDEF domain-containing protein [Muribaculum sp.]MCM1553212.1 GGDEF domain-containing protein [Butyrivibrio sp.]